MSHEIHLFFIIDTSLILERFKKLETGIQIWLVDVRDLVVAFFEFASLDLVVREGVREACCGFVGIQGTRNLAAPLKFVKFSS